MMSPAKPLAALIGMLLAASASAAPLACPSSIQVGESLQDSAPSGWEEHRADPVRYFSGVTFFDGAPHEGRSLVPTRDTPKRGSKDRIATWDFGAETTATPVWIACRYSNSGINLTRQLPTSTRSCSVTYRGLGMVTSIDCR